MKSLSLYSIQYFAEGSLYEHLILKKWGATLHLFENRVSTQIFRISSVAVICLLSIHSIMCINLDLSYLSENLFYFVNLSSNVLLYFVLQIVLALATGNSLVNTLEYVPLAYPPWSNPCGVWLIFVLGGLLQSFLTIVHNTPGLACLFLTLLLDSAISPRTLVPFIEQWYEKLRSGTRLLLTCQWFYILSTTCVQNSSAYTCILNSSTSRKKHQKQPKIFYM